MVSQKYHEYYKWLINSFFLFIKLTEFFIQNSNPKEKSMNPCHVFKGEMDFCFLFFLNNGNRLKISSSSMLD